MLISAAEATGLRTVELLPEPVAAVFAPVMGQPPSPGDLVLVYDFGGGTFDTALVRIGAEQHEVLGSAALDDCGGLDLDAVLTSSLTASSAEHGCRPRSGATPGQAATAQRFGSS